MSRKNDMTDSGMNLNDTELDLTLRPKSFSEFTGQDKIVDNLKVFIQAAKQRNEPLDHVLLTGPPGLGKTTLSYIITREMNSNIKTTSGPVIDKPADLAGILTSLEEGDILFIDEIHRLSNVVEEYLYSAMEDYRLDIMIDSGPGAKSIQIALKPFTLIGATTRAGLITAPLRSRFGILNRLDYYEPKELMKVVYRSCSYLNVNIEEDGAWEIATRSRGTPRITNRLLRRTRDFAQVKGTGIITKDIARMALDALDVDKFGLDEMDKRIILTIIEKYNGGPVGLGTIATAVSEEAGTIEEVYEPFLIREGLISRTPRGRVATDRAYSHFGYKRTRPNDLFDFGQE
jgi:Holliday junction DNA helicase RuvB